MITTDANMRLDYTVCTDRQPPVAWVTFDNPLGGTSTAPLAFADDPEIIAKAEELNALIAARKGLTRADPPALPDPAPAV